MQILDLLLHCCTSKASVSLAGVWREQWKQTDTHPRQQEVEMEETSKTKDKTTVLQK